METPQNFIQRYFDERRELKRGWLGHSQGFRKRFFQNVRLPIMEKGGSERVERVETNGDEAQITTSEVPYEGLSANRHRYRIKRRGESWVIAATEWECFLCKGSGRNHEGACQQCGGEGWKDYGEHSS